MNLTVKDMAALLNVSEKTIYRMISNDTIPCFRVSSQWRFDKNEIASWLEDNRSFSKKVKMDAPSIEDEEIISIAEFIQRGGIYYDIPAGSKQSVILNCLEHIQTRIQDMDTGKLLSLIMERENLCSTAVGHGVALPHPKTFVSFGEDSYIALCHLQNPIPFEALDHEDVNTLFFIFPKSERRFLRIQSVLLRLLKDEEVLSMVKQVSPYDKTISVLFNKEAEIFKSPLV
ncbi:MAG: PTS sugar transporter subunit IIA [Nitrospirae bacterium]|nr:PTS sugar transporter subunit IIA [Nitrospirota bacterium]MBF0535581.1 PTS sugar transporter subunit IIA [Nitrospirota bacterium]MBF0617464.1 PTS sugar transporter subunit IIA [Nitrospirota bacterium]